MIAFVTVLLSPVDFLRIEFLKFINEMNYRSILSGQVTVLQMHLNNTFDFSRRGIEILNSDNISVFIWFKNESQESDFVKSKNETNNHLILRFKSEALTVSDQSDFVVRVPGDLAYLEQRIKAVIEQYKLAGKRYKIIYYEYI